MTRADLPDRPVSDRFKGGLILLLAGIAGFVDAVGFLNLANLFTSHMSGNSAAAGVYFGHGDWPDTLHRFFPIPVFVFGVITGAFFTEAAISRQTRSVFWRTLTLEAAVLIVYLIAGDHEPNIVAGAWPYYALGVLPSFAMGLQSASLRRVGHSTVRTTYVTGMLTEFAEATVAYLFWRAEQAHGVSIAGHSTRPSPEALGRALVCGGIWLAFMAGAGLGSFADTYWRFDSLVAPIAGLLIVILIDLRRPLYTKPA